MVALLVRAITSGAIAAALAQLAHNVMPGAGGILAASVVFSVGITAGVVWAASGD